MLSYTQRLLTSEGTENKVVTKIIFFIFFRQRNDNCVGDFFCKPYNNNNKSV